MLCLARREDRRKGLQIGDLLKWCECGPELMVRRVKAGLPSERRIVGLRLASTFFFLVFAISLEIAAESEAGINNTPLSLSSHTPHNPSRCAP
jgi:hypothetical protein